MTLKEKYNFTDVQLRKIFEYLEKIDEVKNDITSSSEITDLEMYVNADSQFACTFLETELGMSGMSLKSRYTLINSAGDVVNLVDYTGSETSAREYISNMTKLTL